MTNRGLPKREKRSKRMPSCCGFFCQAYDDDEDVNTKCPNKSECRGYIVNDLMVKTSPIGVLTGSQATLSNQTLSFRSISKSTPDFTDSKTTSVSRMEPVHKYTSFPSLPKEDGPKSKKHVMTADQEEEMVTKVLNKFSTIFTLDEKESVPKDPLLPPIPQVVVPKSLHGGRHLNPLSQRSSKHNQFPITVNTRINVHEEEEPPLVLFPPATSNKPPPKHRQMTPSIEETIRILGTAQRPRNLSFIVKHEKKACLHKRPPGCQECVGVQEKKDPSNYVEKNCSIQEVVDAETSTNNSRSEKQLRYGDVEKRVLEQNASDDDVLSLLSVQPALKPLDFAETDPSNDQNLKWKIIIKHHTDEGSSTENHSRLSQSLDEI